MMFLDHWLLTGPQPPFSHGHARRYTNARGEGRFFSFDLLDVQGGEIRAVGWNDQVRGRAGVGVPRVGREAVGCQTCTLPAANALMHSSMLQQQL